MKKISLSGLIIAALIVSGCSTTNIITNHSKDVDMAQYKTFNFVPITKNNHDLVYYSEINQRMVRDAIAKELTERGYTPNKQKPELMIHIYLKVQEKQQLVTSYPYAGRGDFIGIYGGYRYEPVNIHSVDYTEGTLIIDFVDTAQNKLVWQGVAIDSLKENNKKRKERIDKVIKKVFEKYPVKPITHK